MVAAIRNIERALGNGIKEVGASEARNRPVARKSIVAARAIRAGEAFDAANTHHQTSRHGHIAHALG